jgi:hypothetical protein
MSRDGEFGLHEEGNTIVEDCSNRKRGRSGRKCTCNVIYAMILTPLILLSNP